MSILLSEKNDSEYLVKSLQTQKANGKSTTVIHTSKFGPELLVEFMVQKFIGTKGAAAAHKLKIEKYQQHHVEILGYTL